MTTVTDTMHNNNTVITSRITGNDSSGNDKDKDDNDVSVGISERR